MCQIPSQTLCRRLPLIQRNKIATRPSNSPRRPQITRTLGRQMGHEIQRKEMLHNEHETEIELLLPTRSAHSRTSKDKSILVLNISDDLKRSSHISKITSKTSSTLGFLQRNLRQCPQECKKIAYLAMVRSTLEYGCLIWDPYIPTRI